MPQLGRNAHDAIVEPVGRRTATSPPLDDADDANAAVCWSSDQPRCCIRVCRSRTGCWCMTLVTGHPDRAPREPLFQADLTNKLRAWPANTWNKVGRPQAPARAAVAAGNAVPC